MKELNHNFCLEEYFSFPLYFQESDHQDLEQTGDNDKLRAEVYALQVG